MGSKLNIQIVTGYPHPVPDTNRVDGRFLHLRLTNVLLTKLNAGKSAIYLQYKSIESHFLQHWKYKIE